MKKKIFLLITPYILFSQDYNAIYKVPKLKMTEFQFERYITKPYNNYVSKLYIDKSISYFKDYVEEPENNKYKYRVNINIKEPTPPVEEETPPDNKEDTGNNEENPTQPPEEQIEEPTPPEKELTEQELEKIERKLNTTRNEIYGKGEAYWKTWEYKNSNMEQLDIGTWKAYDEGYTGKNVKIAVLDTGYTYNHYDLKNQAVDSKSFNSYTYDTNTNRLVYDPNGLNLGQLEEIILSDNGSNYTVAPEVIIKGDGTGAEAIAVVGSDGKLKIHLTNHGENYTYANVILKQQSGSYSSSAIIDKVVMANEDVYFHGTAVASVIGAERNNTNTYIYDSSLQGVAFDSEIMPIKVFDNNNRGYTNSIISGIDYATTNGADVINMSLGSSSGFGFSTTNGLETLTKALDNNTSIVMSAGNSGLSCTGPFNCSYPAMLPWTFYSSGYDLLNRDGAWVVVGSVGTDKVISDFSNRAGLMKDNFLVALGERVKVAYLTDYDNGKSYAYSSGTSFSAPIVSGAMGLMYQKYPFLKGREIAQIYFDTAEDLGEPGVDDIYGHGLIDIEKAFSPIGELKLRNYQENYATSSSTNGTTNNTNEVNINNTYLSIPRILSKNFKTNATLKNIVALDNYNRAFNIDISNNVIENPTEDNFDFDNFEMAKYKNFLIGFDELRQNIMIGYNYNYFDFMVSFENNYFNIMNSGGFSLKDEKTFHIGIKNKHYLYEKLNLAYQLEYSNSIANSNSYLISEVNDISSLSLKVALNFGNDFGVFYEQPRRILSGDIKFNLPTSQAITGQVVYDNENISLKTADIEEKIGFHFKIFGMNISLSHSKNYLNTTENNNEVYISKAISF